MELIGHTMQVAGELVIAFTVLSVHHRVREEHKIDKKVFMAMKKERVVGIIGILFILVGYFLQVPFKI